MCTGSHKLEPTAAFCYVHLRTDVTTLTHRDALFGLTCLCLGRLEAFGTKKQVSSTCTYPGNTWPVVDGGSIETFFLLNWSIHPCLGPFKHEIVYMYAAH